MLTFFHQPMRGQCMGSGFWPQWPRSLRVRRRPSPMRQTLWCESIPHPSTSHNLNSSNKCTHSSSSSSSSGPSNSRCNQWPQQPPPQQQQWGLQPPQPQWSQQQVQHSSQQPQIPVAPGPGFPAGKDAASELPVAQSAGIEPEHPSCCTVPGTNWAIILQTVAKG